MKEQIWSCKIGGVISEYLSDDLDRPMREAMKQAFLEITGVEPEFTFSGWGAKLTDQERKVVEGK